jgi:uncharacterized cupredoxin-like copper-binding protein
MRLLGASLGMVALAAACANAKPATGGRVVRVKAQDFKFEAPAVVPAGDVVISAHNLGPDAHELIVARADSAGDLPLRPDGITVDEDAIEGDTAGAIEPFGYGATEEFSAHLDPGRYVFFCNMSGHFLGGMHAVVIVR